MKKSHGGRGKLLGTVCIIIEDKNGGQGKVYPNPYQTFQAEFNELLFISIALKPNQNFMDCLMIRSRGTMQLHR